MSLSSPIAPETPEALAAALADAASKRQSILLGGRFTKNRMAGPVPQADVTITTSALTRVLSYEPRDLTISVEAGMRYSDLRKILAGNNQMVPLDPPFAENATVGGILGSNSSGPRRRLYGTARDLVIGLRFATLEGKIVQSGGMVVKNVAGLDMGKLMIGSFGTLAALAVVNFKVMPAPVVERQFLLTFESIGDAAKARNALLNGVLQVSAIDLLNPAAARFAGVNGFVLAVTAGGNEKVIERYERDLRELGPLSIAPEEFGETVREFTPHFLVRNAGGAVVRISCTLAQVPEVVGRFDAPVIARAGSGVCYAYFSQASKAEEAARGPWKAIIEFSPEAQKESLELWPGPGPDFELMRRIKQMLDPHNLLNRGRLYRRI
ncbi:MAG: FAD-binding oxidoreductase [Bryobacteraceae bacterium]